MRTACALSRASATKSCEQQLPPEHDRRAGRRARRYISTVTDSAAKQRMLRGEEYQATDPQLTAERERCSILCERINALSAADEPARLALFRELLGDIGNDTLIQSPFRCDYGYN